MVEPWPLVASWATPTALFVLLNIIVVVIALTSIFASRSSDHPPPQHATPEHHHHHQQETPGILVRAPSLFSRVSSFSFSQLNYNSDHSYGSSTGEAAPNTSSVNALLARSPSLLSRMTSFNSFSFYRSAEPENPPATDEAAPPASSVLNGAVSAENAPLARAPSLLSRMSSFNSFSLIRSAEPENSPAATDDKQPHPQPYTEIKRTPSLLSRMASFSFSLYGSAEAEPAPSASEAEPAVASEPRMARATTEPKKRKGAAQESKMKKSSSEKAGKWKETASFGGGYEEEVDAKADDFINRFKQQLRLQRLDSLLRYRNSAGAAQ